MINDTKGGSYKQIASYDNEEGNEVAGAHLVRDLLLTFVCRMTKTGVVLGEGVVKTQMKTKRNRAIADVTMKMKKTLHPKEEGMLISRFIGFYLTDVSFRRDEEGSSEHHSVQSHRGGGQGNGRDMPPRGGDYSGRRGQYDDRGGRQQWQDGRGGRDRFHHMQFPHMMMGRDGGGYGGPPMGMGYGGAGGSMGWGGGGIGYGGGYGGPGYMPPQRGPGMGMYNMPPIVSKTVLGYKFITPNLTF